ncbi:MAG: hypothetical protein LBE12_04095 [Planctomycetaceae bacterium]|jgi:hypothetical protein|nr:hypothetical protein [Planctomycetaceae bacterium]
MLGSTSQINNFMNMFGVQQGLSMEQIANMTGVAQVNHAGKINPTNKANPIDKTNQIGETNSIDSVTISPAADMMQQLLNMELQNPSDISESGELDLTGLAQLKQRGNMLSNMLQVKLKNFESNLITGMKSAGLDWTQDMNMKNGDNGLLLTNDMPNKESVQNFLQNNGKFKEQFQELAQFANILETLQQLGSNISSKPTTHQMVIPPAAQYTQQSQPIRSENQQQQPEAGFIIHIMRGQASYSFE